MQINAAVVQIDPQLARNAYNRELVIEQFHVAASNGAQLVVFPECAISGYGFDSLESALPAVESVPGPASVALEKACAAAGAYAVVGFLEVDEGIVYNSAMLVGPAGLIGVYRKMHLPCLGVDRFTTPGNFGFPVWETPIGRIGIAICYDLRFPEALRCLGLRGAEIVALPTNWPVTSESMPEFVARARALENRIFLLACNRVGEESGFRFFGRSVMVDPSGKIMTELDDASGIGYANFDPERARQKRIVIRPGQFELDTYSNRRPSFYTTLIEE